MREHNYIANPEAYKQTLAYYNRVDADNGTLISAYDTNEVYHALNLLRMQDRDYKLYAAYAGLQKTDNKIDKLYDLGKNGVDQTFAGNDRPFYENNLQTNNKDVIAIEKSATNYILNSDAPSNQSVSVSNEPYTIHFEGSGTITLSGAYNNTIQGTAGQRTEYTFTPASGTLDIAFSGTCEKVQLEKGNYATLYIQTQGSTVTRAAQDAIMQNLIFNSNSFDPGFVYVWVDFIQDPNVGCTIFSTAPSFRDLQISSQGANQMRMRINNVIRWPFSEQLVVNKRYKYFFAITWAGGIFRLFGRKHDSGFENFMHINLSQYSIDQNIILGSRGIGDYFIMTSTRFIHVGSGNNFLSVEELREIFTNTNPFQ